MSLSKKGMERHESAIDYVNNLKAGEHGCIFFTSQEIFSNIQFSFIKSGLEDNWGTVYLTASETKEEVRNHMKHYGIDTEKFEREGSLMIIKGDEIYKDPQNPDIASWTETAKTVSMEFVKQGKKGARIAADLSSYFIANGLTRQWFELEYSLEKTFSLPLAVICGYDAMLLPAARDLEIIDFYGAINRQYGRYVDVHSFVIYANRNKLLLFTL